VRKLLDALYDGAAALAALFMVGLLGMVLLSIVSRQLQFHLPGTDAYAGYLMAAAGFLALAHTLKRGEHIRVTLLITALKGRSRRALELWRWPWPCCCRCCRPATPAGCPGSRTAFTTFQPPVTPRHCGCRSWRWPPAP